MKNIMLLPTIHKNMKPIQVSRGDKVKISKQKIEIAMIKQGLTLTKLAEKSGLSRQSLATIRSRETCQPRTAAKICAGLGCEIEEIIPTESEART